MGLLEKAEKIQTDEPDETPKNNVVAVPDPIVQPDPTPEPEPKKAKKSRRRSKSKKAKKERVPKVIPDGFEKAGRARSAARYVVDFIVNFGLMAFLIGLFIMFYTDITYPLIASIILALGNVFYLPSKFSRSAGNIVSGTKFVNTRGDAPSFLYHIGKSLNVPLVFLGMVAMMYAISSGTEWTTGMKAFVGIAITLMLIPLVDRLMYRIRDDDLGFWDTLFGGVWLVTASKEASDSGIIQRLQSIGDYAEQRGMLTENDGNSE
tara:strand:- start:1055 stop:1843 length:789 start_codon:yes stop_codon:yes gene_type:complete